MYNFFLTALLLSVNARALAVPAADTDALLEYRDLSLTERDEAEAAVQAAAQDESSAVTTSDSSPVGPAGQYLFSLYPSMPDFPIPFPNFVRRSIGIMVRLWDTMADLRCRSTDDGHGGGRGQTGGNHGGGNRGHGGNSGHGGSGSGSKGHGGSGNSGNRGQGGNSGHGGGSGSKDHGGSGSGSGGHGGGSGGSSGNRGGGNSGKGGNSGHGGSGQKGSGSGGSGGYGYGGSGGSGHY
ncbi:hypothetical protein PG985_007543 [Apiospora marii]|uniref:uncharacterized protein n=1 Tax=Apiospora marii TaxID=335849 RepID=UPI003131131B